MKKRNIVTYTPMQILASEENIKQRYPWVANEDSDSNARRVMKSWQFAHLPFATTKREKKNGEKFLFSK